MAVINTVTQESTYTCDRCKTSITKETSDGFEVITPPPGWRLIRLFSWDGTKNLQHELCDRCAAAACQFLAGVQIAPVGAR